MTIRNWFAPLALVSGISLAAPALAEHGKHEGKTTQKPAKDKAQKHAWKDAKAMKEHLSAHVKYPATKADILKACNDTSDLSADDKASFAAALPDGTYKSADEIVKALGL